MPPANAFKLKLSVPKTTSVGKSGGFVVKLTGALSAPGKLVVTGKKLGTLAKKK